MASELEQMTRRILNVPPADGKVETCREPKLPQFVDMADACRFLGVDDSLDAFSPKFLPPEYDLGHDEIWYYGLPHLVYATIDHGEKQTCRLTGETYP